MRGAQKRTDSSPARPSTCGKVREKAGSQSQKGNPPPVPNLPARLAGVPGRPWPASLAVYDGHKLLGFVFDLPRGGAEATDPAGHQLGHVRTRRDAVAAIIDASHAAAGSAA